MTRPRLPINAPASLRRRGGARGTGAASGSPPLGSGASDALPAIADGPWLLENREVARLLGIGRTKTFQLMASGDLPTIRLGRCVRVPAAALSLWITAQTSAADN